MRSPAIPHDRARPMGLVVHEADDVSSRSVDDAERLVGSDAIHVRASDATWPEDRPGRSVRVVPSARDDRFLDELAVALDHVADAGRRRAPQDTTVAGVDLAGVAFYEWLYASAPGVHRAWAVQVATREHLDDDGPLVWVPARPTGADAPATLERHHPDARILAARAPARPADDSSTTPRVRLRSLAARAGLGRARRALGRTRRLAAELAKPVAALPVASGRRVLFLDQYAHTARILAAAGAPLAEHRDLDPLHVGTDATVAAAGAPYLPTAELWSTAPRRVRGRALLAERRARRAAGIAVGAVLDDEALGLGALAALAGPELHEATARCWGVAARTIVLVEHLLAVTDPAAVVTTSLVASSVRAACLLTGDDDGCPVLWVQHGIVRTPTWKTRVLQDVFLVWGARDRRKLVEAGVDPAAVEVTGSSQFESIATRREHAGNAPSATGPSVLYLPSRSGGNLVSHEAARTMRDLVVEATAAVGARLVVKPHPGDRSGTFDGLGQSHVEVRVGAELVGEILAADVVVVATSTAGLEACALGRPVVALAIPGVSVAPEYVDYGATVLAADLGKLRAALTSVLHDPAVQVALDTGRAALVDDLFAGLEPGVGHRITEAIVRRASAAPDLGGPVVAWYDLDEIGPEQLTAVLDAAGPRPVVHLHRGDARWAAGEVPDGHRRDVLPSHRDPQWRDGLGRDLDAAFAALRADGRAGARVAGRADLLELARYDLFHVIAPLAHRAWVLQVVQSRYAPASVLWVPSPGPSGAPGPSFGAGVADGVGWRVLGPPPPARVRRPSAARALAWARGRVAPLRRVVRSVRQGGPGLDAAAPTVLAFEQFERGAGVTATVLAARPRHLRARVLAGAPEVLRATLGAIPADTVASVVGRRARLEAELAARRSTPVAAALGAHLADPAHAPAGAIAGTAAAGLVDLLAPRLAAAARHAVLAGHAITLVRPVAVVSSTNAPSLVRAAAFHARAKGIPSWFVQHGLLLLYEYRRHLAHDHFAVWGEADRQALLDAGVDDDAIAVCGSPQFEALAACRARSAAVPSADGPTVLYLPSRSGGRFVSEALATSMLDAVVAACPPGARLVVKPHPHDTTATFDGLPAEVVRRSPDPLADILGADVVVASTSTAGLEAMALDRHVVILAPDGLEVPEEAVRYGASVADDETTLAAALLTAVAEAAAGRSPAYGSLVDDLFGGLEPGAAQRAAAAIAADTTGGARQRGAPALVSVVIPVLDGADSLPVQLAALAAQDYEGDWEIVVADNGSTDGTAEVARSWTDRLPWLRVVDASAERGINPARNAGAAAAAGDFVLLCDADDEAQPGWVREMAAAAAAADLVGGRLDETSLNDDVVATWRPHNAGQSLPVALRFLPFAVGANCGAWADVIRDVGGFDPEYRRGGADVEFFWKAQLAGYRLAFAPDAVMGYRHRPGLKPLAKQFWKYGMADAQLYRAFRSAGMPRDTLGEVVRAWRMVAIHGVRSRDPGQRGTFVRTLVYRAGRARGSLRQRVLFL